MMCVGCKQAKPGGSFWEDGEHWRFCKECRDRLRSSLRQVDAPVNYQVVGDHTAIDRFRALAGAPPREVPSDNLRPSTRLPGSILRVIRQLGVRA
jgi:hypothetical protein